MTTSPQPADRTPGQPRQQPAGRRQRGGRREADPYRPQHVVVLAISPQMRARYPNSPLSLYEALQRGHPDAAASENAVQPDWGPSFWAELPGNLRAPCQARAAIRQVLTSWGMSSLAPDSELLASELVANAAEHTPGRPIGLSISQTTTDAGRPGIRCEITDTSPDLPSAGLFERAGERGRGLAIVTALAADSGITTRPGGKTAWFTLTTPEDPAPAVRTAGPEAEAGA